MDENYLNDTEICDNVLDYEYQDNENLSFTINTNNLIESLRELEFTKTHPDAKLPSRAHDNDSGYDVYAVEDAMIPKKGRKEVSIGLEFAHIPDNIWVRVEARSGLSFKHGIIPHNGIIDNGYRGPAGILLYNHSDKDYCVNKGDKIAQLVLYPLVACDVSFTETKTETDRNAKGFGSTGK